MEALYDSVIIDDDLPTLAFLREVFADLGDQAYTASQVMHAVDLIRTVPQPY